MPPQRTQFWGKMLTRSALERAMQPPCRVLKTAGVFVYVFRPLLLLFYALSLFLLPTSSGHCANRAFTTLDERNISRVQNYWSQMGGLTLSYV